MVITAHMVQNLENQAFIGCHIGFCVTSQKPQRSILVRLSITKSSVLPRGAYRPQQIEAVKSFAEKKPKKRRGSQFWSVVISFVTIALLVKDGQNGQKSAKSIETFLQQREARALTMRTERIPIRKVKMEDNRKHHHFRSLMMMLVTILIRL